jgi:hypothetical protein
LSFFGINGAIGQVLGYRHAQSCIQLVVAVWRLKLTPLLQKGGISICVAGIGSDFGSCLKSMLDCFFKWFFEFAIRCSFVLLVGFVSISCLLVLWPLLTVFLPLQPRLLFVVEVENEV